MEPKNSNGRPAWLNMKQLYLVRTFAQSLIPACRPALRCRVSTPRRLPSRSDSQSPWQGSRRRTSGRYGCGDRQVVIRPRNHSSTQRALRPRRSCLASLPLFSEQGPTLRSVPRHEARSCSMILHLVEVLPSRRAWALHMPDFSLIRWPDLCAPRGPDASSATMRDLLVE